MAVKRFGGGKKRELDKPLNLIPFISFLSVVVSFLIATAAWNQLVQIEITLPSQGAPSEKKDPNKPELSLTIIVTEDELQIAGAGAALPPIPNKNGEYDLEALDKKLKDIQEKFPDNRNALVMVESEIIYEKVVNVVDVALQNGIDGLSLTPYTSAKKLREAAGK